MVASVAVTARPAPSMPPPRRAAPSALAAVVRAAREGRPGAFAELHRRFAPVVHGIALAHVGPADAEDVTQDVFLRVHGKLGTLRDEQAFPAWICRLARNAARDHARTVGRRVARAPLPDEPAAPPAPTPDDELRERVLRRLAELPAAYRETLFLRLAEGLTGPEIAERTGLTPASVRVNLCRGMALLRPLLEEDGWQ